MMKRKGALEGLRVLDLTRVLAGPFCTMMFADMGAEIIKIEQAGSGDDTRQMGPFRNGESAYFVWLNRGKQSVTLDFKQPQDMALLQRLLHALAFAARQRLAHHGLGLGGFCGGRRVVRLNR